VKKIHKIIIKTVNSPLAAGGRPDSAGRLLNLASFFCFPEASSGQAVFWAIAKNERSGQEIVKGIKFYTKQNPIYYLYKIKPIINST